MITNKLPGGGNNDWSCWIADVSVSTLVFVCDVTATVGIVPGVTTTDLVSQQAAYNRVLHIWNGVHNSHALDFSGTGAAKQ